MHNVAAEVRVARAQSRVEHGSDGKTDNGVQRKILGHAENRRRYGSGGGSGDGSDTSGQQGRSQCATSAHKRQMHRQGMIGGAAACVTDG